MLTVDDYNTVLIRLFALFLFHGLSVVPYRAPFKKRLHTLCFLESYFIIISCIKFTSFPSASNPNLRERGHSRDKYVTLKSSNTPKVSIKCHCFLHYGQLDKGFTTYRQILNCIGRMQLIRDNRNHSSEQCYIFCKVNNVYSKWVAIRLNQINIFSEANINEYLHDCTSCLGYESCLHTLPVSSWCLYVH